MTTLHKTQNLHFVLIRDWLTSRSRFAGLDSEHLYAVTSPNLRMLLLDDNIIAAYNTNLYDKPDDRLIAIADSHAGKLVPLVKSLTTSQIIVLPQRTTVPEVANCNTYLKCSVVHDVYDYGRDLISACLNDVSIVERLYAELTNLKHNLEVYASLDLDLGYKLGRQIISKYHNCTELTSTGKGKYRTGILLDIIHTNLYI